MQAESTAPPNPLALVFFGLGIVALMYAWRRTIYLSRGRWASPDCTAARLSQAHLQIEQISGEEWMAKRASSLLIPRNATGLDQPAAQCLSRLGGRRAQD